MKYYAFGTIWYPPFGIVKQARHTSEIKSGTIDLDRRECVALVAAIETDYDTCLDTSEKNALVKIGRHVLSAVYLKSKAKTNELIHGVFLFRCRFILILEIKMLLYVCIDK